MNRSDASSKETIKAENDSFDRKGLSDGETTQSSDMSSCYEINVHENFSSDSDTSKGSGFFYARPKLMVKVKKVGGNKEDRENNHNTHLFVENLKRIANPLIESYYPFLEEHQIGNITIEINLNSLNPDGKGSEQKKENVCKSVDEKSGEYSEDSSSKKSYESATSDNQEMKEEKKLAVNSFSKLRKKLKRQILQDMLTRKDAEFKNVQWKDVDEPLHIHHHEHHHHYYVDASKLKEESEFSLLQGVSNSPVHWPDNKENDCRTTDTLNSDVDVKERERSSYLYDCSRQHPVNFLLEKNNCDLGNLTFVRKSKEEYMKFADKSSYRTAPIKPMKKASSMDSLGQKKSDYIIFHNYSDTEISKCDSEESSSTDAPSLVSNMKITKAEHKREKLPDGESEVVAGNVVQGNDWNSSALKKPSDEQCHEKEMTSTENLNKNQDHELKSLEEKNEDGKGELENLVENEEEKSRPIPVMSSESEPANVKTDKDTSDENATSTTTTTSAKDTVTALETSEDGLSNSDEKFTGSKISKSSGHSGDKTKSFNRKKVDSNGQVGVKPKSTFGISSGNSKNKGTEKNCKIRIHSLNIILNNNFGQQGKIADKLLSTAKNSYHYLDSRKDSLRFWSQKLRQELKQIKSELRSLEEKHMRDVVQRQFEKMRAPRPYEYSENGISVYSARTYIVGSSNFKLVNDLPERDFPILYENENTFTQKQITYLYSSPKRRERGGVHTESKFSTKEKGFYWNEHFVSRGRKQLIRQ